MKAIILALVLGMSGVANAVCSEVTISQYIDVPSIKYFRTLSQCQYYADQYNAKTNPIYGVYRCSPGKYYVTNVYYLYKYSTQLKCTN